MPGLLPLEFTDCLTDSPYFRENLHAHERELDATNALIRALIKDVKELLSAAKALSKAQRNMANRLSNFSFNCIGGSQTDDEIVIAGSLKEFGRLLMSIEDERDRMLERAEATMIAPIENFRLVHIGGAKEGKKKFDKETQRFCQSLERHLNMSTRKSENHLQEADASLEMEQRHFVQASLEYVLKLQEVHERKKFEFVETILSFMYGWLTFYHQGHEAACEFKTFMTDLQIKLQKTRENYQATQNEAENLMQKMLEARKTDTGALNKMYTRQGYLFYMEKKAFGEKWIKQFCQYQKENRKFTMLPYNQTFSKITTSETITLKECIRRMSDSIDKRFCFDIISQEKPGQVYTFQALTEEDRKLWLDAMDGKDPLPTNSNSSSGAAARPEELVLDDFGLAFVKRCIELIEERGLDDQGLYRVGGVASKVTKLIAAVLDCRKAYEADPTSFGFDLLTNDDCEIRTITSALKHFFRNLPEPLMTYRLHTAFIAAAKQEHQEQRIDVVHCLVHNLPKPNLELLKLLINHLIKVSNNHAKNLMTVSNLGVCFGPTLLRPEEETVAAIMDIKFGNVVVEILIENCDKIFNTKPAEYVSKTSTPSRISQQSSLPTQPFPQTSNPSSQPVQSTGSYGGRLGPDQQSYSYATVPTRGSAGSASVVYRSGSHDHLAQQQQQISAQKLQRGRPVYHQQSNFYQPAPSSTGAPIYAPQPNASHQAPLASSNVYYPPNGPQPPPSAQQQSRPYRQSHNPWPNSQQQPPPMANEPGPGKRGTSPASLAMLGAEAGGYPLPTNSANSSPSTSQQQFYQNLARQHSQGSFTSGASTPPSLASTEMSSMASVAGRRVRTLYTCIGENPSELSFEPNVIITNVRPSSEPGWLYGVYKGKAGLLPQNYVEFID